MNHPAHRASVERYVTQARLGPYLAETGNDYALAEELYVWNLRVSGAFHEVLGVFEVALRNALCEQLRHWHGKRTGTWLDDPTSTFDARRIEQIKAACRALSQKGKPLTEGHIVAEAPAVEALPEHSLGSASEKGVSRHEAAAPRNGLQTCRSAAHIAQQDRTPRADSSLSPGRPTCRDAAGHILD